MRTPSSEVYDVQLITATAWGCVWCIFCQEFLRDPPLRNIFLSADRFRDGVDIRSRRITEWVTQASVIKRPPSGISSRMNRQRSKNLATRAMPGVDVFESFGPVNQAQIQEVCEQSAIEGLTVSTEGNLSRSTAQVGAEKAFETASAGSPSNKAHLKNLQDLDFDTSSKKVFVFFGVLTLKDFLSKSWQWILL